MLEASVSGASSLTVSMALSLVTMFWFVVVFPTLLLLVFSACRACCFFSEGDYSLNVSVLSLLWLSLFSWVVFWLERGWFGRTLEELEFEFLFWPLLLPKVFWLGFGTLLLLLGEKPIGDTAVFGGLPTVGRGGYYFDPIALLRYKSICLLVSVFILRSHWEINSSILSLMVLIFEFISEWFWSDSWTCCLTSCSCFCIISSIIVLGMKILSELSLFRSICSFISSIDCCRLLT